MDLVAEVERLMAGGFSGAVRIDDGGRTVVERSAGFADRRHQILNTTDTRFAIASGSKGFTALTVMSLAADGALDLDAPVRDLLGDDLPLIDDGVTIRHLLAHRSGIGDYLDESAGHDARDHVMTVPVHQLAETTDYLAVLDGHPQAFPPGTGFAYCNGGFVVLALLAERAGRAPFRQLVSDRVTTPAGMRHTDFPRGDELPADVAIGYLDDAGLRTNVLHLPVRGSGDGGAATTPVDMHRFWRAAFDGRIVPADVWREMTTPVTVDTGHSRRYGLGFWLHPTGDAVILEGYDAGVSFRSGHDPSRGVTFTVVSNSTDGAWAIAAFLVDELLG